LQLSVTWLLALFLALPAYASEMSTLNSSVRALGMGDAFTAVATDGDSLFYNPAGLARVKGLNWKIFDVGAGTSGVSEYSKLTNLKSGSGSSFANSLSSLYGDHVWVGAGGESIFTMPCLGFGVYDHAGTMIQVDNPVYPQMHTKLINDLGYVAGVGVPIGPFVHIGGDLKYIKRTGTDMTAGPGLIADLQSSSITSEFTQWGTGYGADLGATFIIPAPMFSAAFSAAWKNVGGLTFRSTGNSQIPSEPNNITLGSALTFDLPLITITPAVDMTYLTDNEFQLARKLNFGIEVGLPIFDLRAGFREGYYTAGLGMNMGLFRVDAATYGVELGEYPGQIEDRRYVVQFTMKLGVGNFSASDDGKKKGSKKGSSADTESFWGTGRLKQRR